MDKRSPEGVAGEWRQQGLSGQASCRSLARFIDPWPQLIEQHPSLPDDVLEFRYWLEASAAELAAQRATDSDLQRRQEAYIRLDTASLGSERTAQVAADVAFHLTIVESAHNALFAHLTSSLLCLLHDPVRRNISDLSVSPDADKYLLEQHRAIHDAIAARQPEAAKAVAQAHIDYVRNRLHEALRFEERRQSSLRRLP